MPGKQISFRLMRQKIYIRLVRKQINFRLAGYRAQPVLKRAGIHIVADFAGNDINSGLREE